LGSKQATYEEIRNYIKKKYGSNVRTSWIAHAKEIYGIDVKRSHQRTEKRQWPCPDEKLPWIKDAFIEFKMM